MRFRKYDDGIERTEVRISVTLTRGQLETWRRMAQADDADWRVYMANCARVATLADISEFLSAESNSPT